MVGMNGTPRFRPRLGYSWLWHLSARDFPVWVPSGLTSCRGTGQWTGRDLNPRVGESDDFLVVSPALPN